MRELKIQGGKIFHGDCLHVLRHLDEDSVDLVFGSPPYEDRRQYEELQFDKIGQDWVDWMFVIVRECLRVCKGLVAFVVEGKTQDYKYSCAPALLMADLHRAGVCLRKPAIYHRHGIPGSGGPDWLANCWEWIICCTKNQAQLPWSDNTACGHPPKYGAGGQMTHRNVDGTRANDADRQRIETLAKERNISKKEAALELDLGHRRKTNSQGAWKKEGVEGGAKVSHGVYVPPEHVNPGNVIPEKPGSFDYSTGRRAPDGTRQKGRYTPPEKSNPGNVIYCPVGGGLIGSNIAHDNEAPFPAALAEFFVRSFCPVGGVVLDPFSGSGTTAAEAVKSSRKFVAIDLRPSQIELTKRRVVQAHQEKGLVS